MGTTFFYPYKEPRWDQYVLDSLNQCMAAAEEAGTGTARVIGGTRAEREAYATPFSGLLWAETDTGYVWVYWDSAWHCLSKKAETDSAIATAKADAIDQVSDGLLTTGVDYLSSTQVRIPIGKVEINGVVYEVPAAIDLTPTLTASSWHYLYIASPSSGTTITSAEILNTAAGLTTAPSYDAAKGGWYNANGYRCIGVFYTNTTPEIVFWRQPGNWWQFVAPVVDYNSVTPPTTPTAVSLTLPSLGRIRVSMNGMTYGTVEYSYVWVLNGDDARTSISPSETPLVFYVAGNTAAKRAVGETTVITDDSQRIKTFVSSDGVPELQLLTKAFELPPGLRRTN